MAKSPGSGSGISDLPDEILGSIFGKLPLWSQCQAKAVCKHWKARLSSCKTRVKEGWIIVNCVDHLLWYNVDQNRWLKKEMSIASLCLPFPNPRLICVFQELIFFSDNSETGNLICCWNAATNESRLLEIDAVPGKGPRWFGAYTGGKTDGLKLLLHDFDQRFEGGKWKLSMCDVESGGTWRELRIWDWYTNPNFNNLTLSHRVVPFTTTPQKTLHLYDIDRDSLETLDFTPEASGFHFPEHGWFVLGESMVDFFLMPIHLVFSLNLKEEIGVMWYNQGLRKFELVSQTPEGLARSMREESEAVTHLEPRCTSRPRYWYFFCADGVENIWVLLPGCSRMLRFNVVSKEWFTLPSILPSRRYEAGDDDPHVRALYTTL